MRLFPSLFTRTTAQRGSAVLVALLASTTLAACTTQSTQTEDLTGTEGEVQKVVDDFADRADDGDATDICDKFLTAEARTAIAKGGDCAEAVKQAIDRSDYLTLNVDNVKVAGNEAVATIKRVKGDTGQTKLVLQRSAEGAAWQISAFGNEAAKSAGTASTTPAETTPATTAK